jgi:hypothetical protein
MRFLPKIKEKPPVNPKDSNRIVNVDKIARSIEKAQNVLNGLHSGVSGRYNEDAILTWTRILAALQMRWRDIQIEVITNGRYSFYE